MTRRQSSTAIRRSPFIALLLVGALASCGGDEPMVLSIQSAGSERSASDAMIAPVDVSYDLKDDVTVSETSAHAYRVVAPTNVKDDVATLARALGLKGEVRQDDAGTWTLGVDEKRGSGLWAYTSFGPPSWSFFSGAMSPATRAVSEPCAPDDEDCAENPLAPDPTATTSTTVPVDLISEDEAEKRAREVLSALGYADDVAITTSIDSWGTHVAARLSIDGRDASTMAFFDYGDKGALITASGFLGSFERADKYDLISVSDAVKRLSAPLYSGGLVARDLAEGAASDSVTNDSVPSETSIAPKTVIVPITKAEVVLSIAWLGDQSSMLVPSYRFSNDDGEVGTVYAIEDKYIQQAPVDDGQGSGSNEPAPVPDTAVVTPSPDGSPGDSSGGSSGQPIGEVTPIPQSDAEKLVGLSEGEAEKVAQQNGWLYRIVERDGESFMVTADYVVNRVNVVITKGMITKVSVG